MFDKKVLLTIFISFLIAVIISSITDFVNNDELFKAVFTYKTHTKNKYDFIVSGDSRTYVGVSPEIISDSLNLSGLNLSYASVGFSKLFLDKIEEKIDKDSENKTIILGITPSSFTKKASWNSHLRIEEKRKKEEVLETMYLSNIKNTFTATSPNEIWKIITSQERKEQIKEYHIKSGWIPCNIFYFDDAHSLYSYKKRFLKTEISQKVLDEFFLKLNEWKEKGIKVYAFQPPVSYNLSQLENSFTTFNWDSFIKKFISAGGEWINLKGHYHSYDGSHINKASAIKLSSEIAHQIKNNLTVKKYNPSIIINEINEIENIKFKYSHNFDDSLYLNKKILFQGKKVAVLDSTSEIQLCYFKNLGEIVTDSIRKIYIESKMYYSDPKASAKVICNITSETAQNAWFGRNILNSMPVNKWGNIIFEFKIPDRFKEEDKIKIFIKNTNNSKVYFDGFSIYMQ